MTCGTVICDWNGTIIEYRDEKPLLESIALDVFWASVPFHPFRMARILWARRELDTLYRGGHRDGEFDFVREMFRVYNRRIIRGVPVSLIHWAVDRYANMEETQAKLDHRVLRSVKKCQQSGKTTGILSAGYKHGIETILRVAGYNGYFDFCQADRLREENGKAIEFGLNIYKNKAKLLLDLLHERKLDAGGVAYIGDSEDDEGCFEIVGHPIIAFLAPEELKERFARKHRAFVPSGEEDLVNYLKNV